MKAITYIHMTEVNIGTTEDPKIEQTFENFTLYCTDALYASHLAIAKADSYNGEVTVEDVPDVPMPPTVQELAAENKLLHQQVVALTDRGDFQEELIVELANIVYA